jgi:hypothetical protein
MGEIEIGTVENTRVIVAQPLDFRTNLTRVLY